MSTNSDRLKEEVNMLSLVEYLGFEVERKGDAYFFKCPNPNHTDSHPSCYTKDGWKNIYCTSCGYNVTAIDLVMVTKNLDFKSACDFLASFLGSPSWYGKYKKPTANIGNLEQKELKLLGLSDYADYMNTACMLNIALDKIEGIIERLRMVNDPFKLQEALELRKKIKNLGGGTAYDTKGNVG